MKLYVLQYEGIYLEIKLIKKSAQIKIRNEPEMYRIIPREKNVTSGVFKLIYYLSDSTREKFVILLIVITYRI